MTPLPPFNSKAHRPHITLDPKNGSGKKSPSLEEISVIKFSVVDSIGKSLAPEIFGKKTLSSLWNSLPLIQPLPQILLNCKTTITPFTLLQLMGSEKLTQISFPKGHENLELEL
jgi:hypothetical protein